MAPDRNGDLNHNNVLVPDSRRPGQAMSEEEPEGPSHPFHCVRLSVTFPRPSSLTRVVIESERVNPNPPPLRPNLSPPTHAEWVDQVLCDHFY